MAWRHKPGSQPTKREQRVQGWRIRMLRGTERTPQEDLKQAQGILSWALRKHGPDASFSIKAMIDVANLLSSLGRVVEEAELREQIVSGLRNTLGADSLSTVSAEMSLARCLFGLDRYEDGTRLLHHVVAIRSAELGPDDPQTLRAANLQSEAANKLKQLEEAREGLAEL